MDESSNIKKVNLAIIGAGGKMGKILLKLIEQDSSLSYSTDSTENCDVVLDFSSPEGTKTAIQMGLPLVCGTTGLTDEIFYQLENLAARVPVLYSPNFSIGMALFFEVFDRMGKQFKKFSQPKVMETHHLEKKDSPSGSSIRLAKLLGVHKNEILSKREDGVVGDHIVEFFFPHEQLSFKHHAIRREAFALGALMAAKFLFNKPAKLYSLSEIFD